jgi:hypothetical protein
LGQSFEGFPHSVIKWVNSLFDNSLKGLRACREALVAWIDASRESRDSYINRLCQQDFKHFIGTATARVVTVKHDNNPISIPP